jgi:hypothetical protein
MRGCPVQKCHARVVFTAALGFGLAFPGPAHATCGSTACFLSTLTQEGPLPRKSFRFDLSYRYVDQSRKREGSSSTDEVLTPGVEFDRRELELDHHRELRTGFHLIQADLSYGLTAHLSLLASVPLLSTKHHEHVIIEGDEEEFSDGDGTTGFGDVQVGARYAMVASPRDMLVATAAVKLPTGAHERLDTEGAITEPSLQPGTGSTDLSAGFTYSHQVQPLRTEAFVSAGYRHNGTSDLDYKIGDEAQGAAGLTRRLGGAWTASAQVNLRHGTRDRFVGEDVPSTGSTLVNVTPGLRYQTSSLTLYAFLPVPVYQRVNEAQLAPRVGVVVGVSRQF